MHALSEEQLEFFTTHEYLILDHYLPLDLLHQLQAEFHNVLSMLKPAAIQQGIHTAIRSDHTRWLEPHHVATKHFIPQLKTLASTFNAYFFTGIRSIESHYAEYQAGQYYKLHSDNPNNKNHRVISAVFYLTLDADNWQHSDGGILTLHHTPQQQRHILPYTNRLALFRSDLLHEVTPTRRTRHSITAWLRDDMSDDPNFNI